MNEVKKLKDTSISLLHRHRYLVLLGALILHLFGAILVRSIFVYSTVLWPINNFLLGLSGVAIFRGRGRWKNAVRTVLFFLVSLLPIGTRYYGHDTGYFLFLSITYMTFFLFLFREVILFLIKPGYINADIIGAAACGFFLLNEIGTFLFQLLFYQNPACFRGIDTTMHETVFNDFVYFSGVTLTSIGFGDITPTAYYTKLLTLFFGTIGHFYSVVLLGIVISKFASRQKQ